ncbi:hypothetical protein YC2023_066577 [Brassica napus]
MKRRRNWHCNPSSSTVFENKRKRDYTLHMIQNQKHGTKRKRHQRISERERTKTISRRQICNLKK